MTDQIRVNIALDIVVDDEQAMRHAAFERLRAAWSADDDFPYSSASDVPFDQVVNSLLADAVPLELAGCRRGSLEVEVGERTEVEQPTADESEGAESEGAESDGAESEGAESDGAESDGDDRPDQG